MSTNGQTGIASAKSLFRIGEVSRLTDTKPFVLRYWETEFPMLQPVKSPKGHRLYRREDVETVRVIKRLLYDEGFTIAGARRHLREATETQQNVTQRNVAQRSQPDAVHSAEETPSAEPTESAHTKRLNDSHVAESDRNAAHRSEAGAHGEDAFAGRRQASAPSPISRHVLLDLRDSLRAFLTLLENE